MKNLAYKFGIIGYFLIFILCAFEKIMISVNSYGIDTLTSLYLFFGLNILSFCIFILSIINDRYKQMHISFNLSNKGIAILFLGITLLSVIVLINSSKYNLDATNLKVLIRDFLLEPEIYLPLIPLLISSGLFVVSSQNKILKNEKKSYSLVRE